MKPLIKDQKKADKMANLVTGLFIGAFLMVAYYQTNFVCIGNPLKGWLF